MKNFKTLLLIFLGLIIASGISLAADPPKKDNRGYYPPAGTAPSYLSGTVINPKTGKPMTAQEIQATEQAAKEFKLEEARRLAEAERQRQEAERLRQEEAARQPRCSDFEYVGPNARPSEVPAGGYQCPPGYYCHRNGILYECRSKTGIDANTVMTANDPRCFWSFCAD